MSLYETEIKEPYSYNQKSIITPLSFTKSTGFLPSSTRQNASQTEIVISEINNTKMFQNAKFKEILPNYIDNTFAIGSVNSIVINSQEMQHQRLAIVPTLSPLTP